LEVRFACCLQGATVIPAQGVRPAQKIVTIATQIPSSLHAGQPTIAIESQDANTVTLMVAASPEAMEHIGPSSVDAITSSVNAMSLSISDTDKHGSRRMRVTRVKDWDKHYRGQKHVNETDMKGSRNTLSAPS